MRRTMRAAALAATALCVAVGGAGARERGKRLFDGKSFAGWEGDTAQTWRIEDGALVGGSLTETVPRNEFLATTREYGDFELTLEVKLTGTGFANGGIQIRSRRIANPPNEMSGFQVDMGVGYWGSLYDESRRNRTLVQPPPALIQRILRPDEWNRYRIRCEGPRMRIWLNGEQTVDYTETDAAIPATGLIAVQIHGGGKAEARYRNLRIRGLGSVIVSPSHQERSPAGSTATPSVCSSRRPRSRSTLTIGSGGRRSRFPDGVRGSDLRSPVSRQALGKTAPQVR
jgi:hypothetical protein